MAMSRRLLVLTAAAALSAGSVAGVPALADTRPIAPTPATVAADALPTVQVNGVVWAQVIIGTTVYAGGSFTTARPAGAAAGTNTTPRYGLLAYDIRTGRLLPFAPTLNGQVKALAASPDGRRLYVGGDFTRVNGRVRNRLAAFNVPAGSLVGTFAPSFDNSVNAVAVSNSVVYVGGNFTVAQGRQRVRLAALRPADGALLGWAPRASGGKVWALTFSPDRSKLIVGGQFLHLNSNGPEGLGAVNVLSGALVPWKAASQINVGGEYSGIESLTTQGNSVFGTGFVHGTDRAGSLEGAFRADGNTGTIQWIQDCHGDTYSVHATPTVVYTVGHAHDCRNIGGFPHKVQTWHRALAVTRAPGGTVKQNTVPNYANWGGKPAPTLLHFDPHIAPGTFTGQGQGAWHVTGNGTYVVMGGEFPRVNGRGQQGLVRFATTGVAPNDVGPDLTGTGMAPQVLGLKNNFVWARFPANYDPDNETLTYRIRREGIATPITAFTVRSSFWRRPVLGFNDVRVAPGRTYRYRVETVDPFGNTTLGAWRAVTTPTSGTLPAYPRAVLADGARHYWRLDQSSGTLATDAAGGGPGTIGSGVTWRAGGAIRTAANPAARFNGASNGRMTAAYQEAAPTQFSVETWIKTATSRGGKIVGFANTALGNSTVHDRHVYLRNDGRLVFGVFSGGMKTVTSPRAYNDGKWHHVVATFNSGTGMRLYVDGTSVAARTGALPVAAYQGYWRLGGGTLGGWPGKPTNNYYTGVLDDAAVYRGALTAAQVARHYQLSGDTAAQ